jgi:hypothetical protein
MFLHSQYNHNIAFAPALSIKKKCANLALENDFQIFYHIILLLCISFNFVRNLRYEI